MAFLVSDVCTLNNGGCDNRVVCTKTGNGTRSCGACPVGTFGNGEICLCMFIYLLLLIRGSIISNDIMIVYCGDTNCSTAFEDCILCPQDCGYSGCGTIIINY